MDHEPASATSTVARREPARRAIARTMRLDNRTGSTRHGALGHDRRTPAPRSTNPRARPCAEPSDGRRVAPGRCLPGAPTDPDVQNYRIRLFKKQVCYASFGARRADVVAKNAPGSDTSLPKTGAGPSGARATCARYPVPRRRAARAHPYYQQHQSMRSARSACQPKRVVDLSESHVGVPDTTP